MNNNDLLLVGFDLQKDPHVIAAAYDDGEGVTAEFNLNLLRGINRELGGDFDLDKCLHYANYRPDEGSARSSSSPRQNQRVPIEAVGNHSNSTMGTVFMEISQKYTLKNIESLPQESGFEIKQNFFDSRKYYCDSLSHVA